MKTSTIADTTLLATHTDLSAACRGCDEGAKQGLCDSHTGCPLVRRAADRAEGDLGRRIQAAEFDATTIGDDAALLSIMGSIYSNDALLVGIMGKGKRSSKRLTLACQASDGPGIDCQG
jgi:hypothetical protein